MHYKYQYERNDVHDVGRLAAQTRIAIIDALYQAKSGHYGGACSAVEIIQALVCGTDFACREDTQDIFILSKGHAAIAYYAVLNTLGLSGFDLSKYGESAAGVDIHPCIHNNAWVHCSSGSLGQGLAYGLGVALALRDQGRHVWVLLGDGECQEGQVWEAAALASRHQLQNLHAIVDYNNHQECGWSQQPQYDNTPLPKAMSKWKAFGWQAEMVDGHSLEQLDDWIQKRKSSDTSLPGVAIANTVKGAGIPYFEKNPHLSHCTTLSKEHYDAARDSLKKFTFV